jgi:nicotinate-nucleotide adenylyltransferase
VAVARTAISQLGLDRLLVVVDSDPPHRAASHLDSGIRGQLADAAFAALPNTAVRVLGPDDSPFTVDTLRGLTGNDEVFLIVGADQLAALDTWREPEAVRSLATLAVAPRPDVDRPITDAIALQMPPVDLSSSGIRDALRAGNDVTGSVPEPVLEALRSLRVTW